MKRKHLTETPVCPREHLVIISYTPLCQLCYYYVDLSGVHQVLPMGLAP
jgi:hypothetical protein